MQGLIWNQAGQRRAAQLGSEEVRAKPHEGPAGHKGWQRGCIISQVPGELTGCTSFPRGEEVGWMEALLELQQTQAPP